MSKFFEYYKKTDYELSGKVFNLTNITLRYKFKQNLTKNIYNFYDYTLKDGERLDHLADMYYGDSKYVWVIILANDIIDPQFEIPKPDNEFKKYVINKYGTWDNVVRGVHHYERVAIYRDSNGSNLKVADLNPPLIISKEKYDTLLPDERLSVSNLDYELGLNEGKRTLKLLDVSQLPLIINLVEEVFNEWNFI